MPSLSDNIIISPESEKHQQTNLLSDEAFLNSVSARCTSGTMVPLCSAVCEHCIEWTAPDTFRTYMYMFSG
jgi:hypothetical protein